MSLPEKEHTSNGNRLLHTLYKNKEIITKTESKADSYTSLGFSD
jgi:hypothetical protein